MLKGASLSSKNKSEAKKLNQKNLLLIITAA